MFKKFKINPLFYIFLTIFIDMVGFGIAIPILPSYVTRFHTGSTTVGFLIAIYSLMQFLSAPVLGRLSDKYGRKRLLAFSLLGTSIGYLLTGWGSHLILIFAGRMIDGITGGNISVAQAYIADVTTPSERSRAIGLTGAAFGAGFIVGPAIGGLFSSISPQAPFLFAAVVSILNTFAVLFFLPEPKEHASSAKESKFTSMFSPQALKEAFHPPQIGAFVLLFFLINLGFSMIHGTLPLLTMSRLGWNTAHNGYFFAFIGVVSVITQAVLIGRLVKRLGDLPVAIIGFILVGIGLALLGAGYMSVMVFAAGFCIAMGSGLAQATLQGLISKYSHADEQGAVMGIAQGFAALARTFGPLYGGWTYERVFQSFPYFSGAVILVAMGIGSLMNFRWLSKKG